ncbi:MAG: B12-binding domain-containing radical SAM protein [Candidatus Binatia bacterium]
MKVALLNPMPRRRGAVNKDISGGFGTVSDFGDSPVARTLTWLKRRGVSYPVLSLAYIAAIFEREGWDVSYGEAADSAAGADVTLVYSSLVAHSTELRVAKRLRRPGGPPVGFIGPFASVRPDLFSPHADFVIVGEPEAAVERIARDRTAPAGVMTSPSVENLDALPFPAWHHFDIEHFRYRPYFPTGRGFFPVLSSRGCALSCAYYCPYTAVTGRRWRRRTPENVIAELDYLVRTHGAKRILFRDPLFTLDRARTAEIADGIRKAGLDIEWVCETHLDYLDEELLDRMHAAGLSSLKVGIESANPVVLEDVKRHQPKDERIRRLLGHCDRLGVGVVAFYILGLPSDTEESIAATIDYAMELNTIGAQFTIATPYPGTGFFDAAEAEHRLLTEDWERYDIYTPVMRHDHLSSDDIQRLKSRAYQLYYMRTSWAGKFLSHQWRRFRSRRVPVPPAFGSAAGQSLPTASEIGR